MGHFGQQIPGQISMQFNTAGITGSAVNDRLIGRDWAEDEHKIALVRELLGYCPPDSPYGAGWDIVWSVCYLEWDVGEKLVTGWSQKSLSHWGSEVDGLEAQETLSKVISSYDPSKGITISTLFKHAEDNSYSSSPFEDESQTEDVFMSADTDSDIAPDEKVSTPKREYFQINWASSSEFHPVSDKQYSKPDKLKEYRKH